MQLYTGEDTSQFPYCIIEPSIEGERSDHYRVKFFKDMDTAGEYLKYEGVKSKILCNIAQLDIASSIPAKHLELIDQKDIEIGGVPLNEDVTI